MTDDKPLSCEDLLIKLEQLRLRLKKSGVERTVGLRNAIGDDCPYYWKSLNVFLKKDYHTLRAIIREANELFDLCEEEND